LILFLEPELKLLDQNTPLSLTEGSSNIQITGSLFQGNKGKSGSVLSLEQTSVTLTVQDSLFLSNEAAFEGILLSPTLFATGI